MAMTIMEALRRIGVNVPDAEAPFQVHCPFHPDDSPSARVYPSTDTLYCFAECKRVWNVEQVLADGLGIGILDARRHAGLGSPLRPLRGSTADFAIADVLATIASLSDPRERWKALVEVDDLLVVAAQGDPFKDGELRSLLRGWQARLAPRFRFLPE